MWLPKDEWRLLAGYFRNIGSPESSEVYKLSELTRLLPYRAPTIRTYEKGSENVAEATTVSIARYVQESRRVENANNVLQERGLIKLTPHEGEGGVFVIKLTLAGYDLGRRYAKWFDRTGLWFQKWRNHWIWLIVSFLGGVLGALVVQWLSP